jgi:ParB/RepB/Spo0J family partition protein
MNDPDRKLIPLQQIHAPSTLLRHLQKDTVPFAELKESIRQHGVLLNVVVRETAPNEFELIEGLHRWAAAGDCGLTELPCLVRDADIGGVMGLQVVGNAVRIPTTDLEFAHQLRRITEHYRSGGIDLSIKELAGMVCKSCKWVTDRLNLLRLTPKWQKALDEGVVRLGHALVAVTLKNNDQNMWLRSARKLKVRDFELHVMRWRAQNRAESLTTRELERYGSYTPYMRNIREVMGEIQRKEVAKQLIIRYNIVDPLDMAVRRRQPPSIGGTTPENINKSRAS